MGGLFFDFGVRRVDAGRSSHTHTHGAGVRAGHDGGTLRLRRLFIKRVARGLGAAHEMREACKARAKPGETLGLDSICPGLKLGYARLRSAVLRGRDRDGYGESQSAECPKGLRGAIVGVVMSHERTRGQVIKDGKTYEHLDIFQVFYLNGQSEELELDEIAASLEPRQDMSDAPDGLSAPELARRALRARGHDVGGPRFEAPRFIPRGDVAERVARNARLHHAVNLLRKGSPDVAPACYEYVQRGGVYEVDDLVNGARVVTRIPEGAQGEDGLENLEVLAAAAGAVSKGRLSPVIPPDLRRRILFLALDVKLRLLGFDDFAFSPSLNDLCLDHETMNDKFEECDAAAQSCCRQANRSGFSGAVRTIIATPSRRATSANIVSRN